MPKPTPPRDDVDHELLDLLQRDAGRTLRELGDLVALSPSAVQRRIDRLRRNGVIARQVAVLDPHHTAVAKHLFDEAPNVRRYTTMFVLDPVRTGGPMPTRAP